jgi:hypothetical protein
MLSRKRRRVTSSEFVRLERNCKYSERVKELREEWNDYRQQC